MSFSSILKGFAGFAAGALLLSAATTTQASLIGDPSVTFDVELTFDVIGGPSGAMLSDTKTFGPLVNGPDHLFSIADGGAIFVDIDIESEHIFMTVTNVTTFFTAVNIIGEFSFTGLDWIGQDGFIVSADGNTEFDNALGVVIDDGHGFVVGFTHSSFGPGDSIFTEIWFDVVHVPEPGTLALFGLGLAGLGFARRRKAA